ncbi:MAG: RICIN domain-containing protein [Alloprevotella sp.]|nr:RICIN domain-containing protein [Alloprevotella sp.]
MRKTFLGVLLLSIVGVLSATAGPADPPQLSTSSSPVYYVIMNAYPKLDSDNNNEYRYLRYQGWNRNRPKLERVSKNMDDASLWYFVAANGATSASEGCYIASVGAEQETHAYASNTFEGPYLSNVRQYNSNLAFFSQQTADAIWYIQANPYDRVGCAISTGAGVTGNSWYYDNIALIGEDNVFVKTGTIENQDYFKYVFLSYQDLLDIAAANGVANLSTYEAADRTKGVSFKALIQAIDAAKKARTDAQTVAAFPTGQNYLLRNRRHGYYLTPDALGTALQSVTVPTQLSVWQLGQVGGTSFLTSKAGAGSSIRVSISDNTASWNLTANDAYNTTLVKSSDGDMRYASLQKASATNGWFSMNTTANDHAIYARSDQGFASDWEFIPVSDLTTIDETLEGESPELNTEGFYRIRNVARSISDYVADVFDGGGWLEDVDHTHATFRRDETGAFSYDADEATLFYHARTVDYYAAQRNMSHASALWQFELVGHGALNGENATGLLSPEHNIYIIRNANTGRYIGSTIDATTNCPKTATTKDDAARFYLQRLIDGQYALCVYSTTSGTGADVASGYLAVQGTADGAQGGVVKAASSAKNTNSAWIISPAPTLELPLLVDASDYDWTSAYFPFDFAVGTLNAGQTVDIFQGGWLQTPIEAPAADKRKGQVQMTKVQNVPAGNAVFVRSTTQAQGSKSVMLNVWPAGKMPSPEDVAIFEGNVWKGIAESEQTVGRENAQTNDFGDFNTAEGKTARKNYWILTKNSSGKAILAHPSNRYLLPNRAYIDAETTEQVAANINKIEMTFFENETQLVVTGAGYGTLYYDLPLVVPEGVEAAAVTLTDGRLNIDFCYQAGDIIPAETAVLIKARDGRYVFEITDEDGYEPTANDLRGTLTQELTTGGTYYYKLALADATDISTIGFYYGAADGGAFLNDARKAYLVSDEPAPVRGFSFNEQTAIATVQTNAAANVTFDLQGRRAVSPAKGVYIKNGHKVIIK